MVNPEPNNIEYEWEDQLADFSLGVMDAGAASDFERKLGECRTHVTLADQYAHAIGLVGLAAPVAEPPLGHKERFMARLGSTAQEAPPASATATGRTGPLPIIAGPTPPHGLPSVTASLPGDSGPATGAHVIDLGEYRSRRSVGSVVALVGSVAAAVLLVLGLWGWFSTRNEISDLQQQLARVETDNIASKNQNAELTKELQAAQATLNIPPDYSVYMVNAQNPQPRAFGVLFVSSKTNDVELVAKRLDPLPDTKVYEMWWLPKDNSSPVKAGTFKPDETGVARHTATAPTAMSNYAGIAVTEEQAPGVDKAQGPIVLVSQYPTP